MDLLKNLCQISSPSGNEEHIQEYIANEIIDYVDSLYKDALGNLIAVKNGNDKKIMFCAHSDEIGVIVTNIDDNGFLRVSPIGGLKIPSLIFSRVRFLNGVIGAVAYENKIENVDKLKFSNLYVDIGTCSKEESEKLVSIGDVAVLCGDTVINDNYVISKAMDNRAGVYTLINTIKNMPKTDNTLYYVFSSQEELGLRGAKTAAFGINPDIAITVDVTSTGDTPGCRDMNVKTGRGPAIKIKDNSIICSKKICEYLKNTAISTNIPYQLEILQQGGTDAGVIHTTKEGVLTGAISIPCRNIHTSCEVINKTDLDNAVKLLIKSIENGFDV